MNKKIQSALISVFYKDGLESLVKTLNDLGITIYSTGGTQAFIEKLGVPVFPIEKLTTFLNIDRVSKFISIFVGRNFRDNNV